MREHPPPGFTRCETLPTHATTSLVELMGQGSLDAIESIFIRVRDHGLDAVLDVEWSSGTGSHRQNHDRTVFFAYRPESQYPEYCLHPASSAFEPGHRGDHHAEVDRSTPDRSSPSVLVTSPTPESMRRLIERSGLRVDELPEDLVIFGNHNGAIAWRTEDLLSDEDLFRLVQEAVPFLDPIVNRPELGRQVARSKPGTYSEEMLNRLRSTDSRATRLQLAELVTGEDIEFVLAAEPPRRVPPSIRNRILGHSFAIWMCCTVVSALSGLIVVVAVFAGQILHWYAITFMATGGLTLLGSIISRSWRRHRLRILRRGTILPVHVVGVEATEFAEAGSVDHHIRFESSDPDLPPYTLTAGSQAARIAEACRREQRGTTILVHPTRPSDSHWTMGEPAIWLEGMAVDRIPD